MHRVCECVETATLLLWMLISRRFYLKFVPATLRSICIFARKGFRVMANSASIEVFSKARFEWDKLFVK